ncbi:MAG: carbohydrate ABC transporter permease [Dehalococcoidia bacterium]
MEAAAYKVAGRARFRYLLDREWLLGPLMLLPAVLFIVALVGFPFVLAILYSFSDVSVGDTSLDFVGLDNFKRIWERPEFRRALQNTFLFALVSQVVIMVLATTLAEALTQDFRGKWLVRFLIMLPWATPIALATIAWLWLLDSDFSPIDWILRQVHLLGPGTLLGRDGHMVWLGRERLAMASVITVHVWRLLPLSTVILLAGLSSIDKDVLDQAEVDGAGFWRTLFQIKLPLILPIMSIAILFGLIFTFGDMAVVWLLTRGGPVHDTEVLSTWAFKTGIEGGSLAQGAAVALFLFPVLLVVAILVLRTARRMEVR